jgi:hypothetical protein
VFGLRNQQGESGTRPRYHGREQASYTLVSTKSLVELLVEFGVTEQKVLDNVAGPLIKERHGRPIIGCSHGAWYGLIRSGDLEPVRIGGATYVTSASLRDLLMRGRTTPARKLKTNAQQQSAAIF